MWSIYKEFIKNMHRCRLRETHKRFKALSEFLIECIDDVKLMDEVLCTLDKSPNKLLLFSDVNLDSLTMKRRNYKFELENFQKYFSDVSIYEKEIYDEIIKMQNEQKQKFKKYYFIVTDDKQTLSFRESGENELVSDSLDHTNLHNQSNV